MDASYHNPSTQASRYVHRHVCVSKDPKGKVVLVSKYKRNLFVILKRYDEQHFEIIDPK